MNILTYNGQNIEQRVDGYVNATQMCIANGKKITDWTRTDDAQRYIEAIALKTGIPANSLLIYVSDGFPAKKAYWIHPDLAIKLGRWISVDFEIWCDTHIKTLIETGSTQIAVKEVPQLPPHKLAVEVSRNIREITDNLTDNPRLAQILVDFAMNSVIEQKALTSGEPQWRGVNEIANEMGFKTDMSSRVRLGQFISQNFDFEKKKEKRICNNTTQEINCYLDTEELRQAIAAFFS